MSSFNRRKSVLRWNYFKGFCRIKEPMCFNLTILGAEETLKVCNHQFCHTNLQTFTSHMRSSKYRSIQLSVQSRDDENHIYQKVALRAG